METATWIAIYLPLFMLLFIILPMQQNQARAAAQRIRAKRRNHQMTNEIIGKYIGKDCLISTGTAAVGGRIVSVTENWIEVETKKGLCELVNADYVQSIRILEK